MSRCRGHLRRLRVQLRADTLSASSASVQVSIGLVLVPHSTFFPRVVSLVTAFAAGKPDV